MNLRKTISAALAGILLSVQSGFGVFAYNDVPPSDPYAEAIEFCQMNNLMSGYEDGNFHPQDSLSRGMTAVIIYRFLGEPDEYTYNQSFADVPASSFYKKASNFMKESGIMSGNLNTNGTFTFDGEQNVKRGDLALILYRLVQQNVHFAYGVSNPFLYNQNTYFSDLANDHYAYSALDWAVANHLLEPAGTSIFADQPASRAVTANFLYEMIKVLDSAAPDSSGQAIPSPDDPATEANVLALLHAYDPDGEWILRMSNAKNPFLSWWSSGASLYDRIDVAVHEQCHVLTHMGYEMIYNGVFKSAYYIGNGQKIEVVETPVYNSKEMVPILNPELNELSFRYPTYIDPGLSENVGSQIDGIYGLFNEFTAYCWDANNRYLLWDYYKEFEAKQKEEYPGSPTLLFTYDGEAYGEFMYWMLSYMLYARDHYPQIYEQILANEPFKQAFRIVDDKFLSVLEKQRHVQDLSDRYVKVYERFQKELQLPAYQEIYQLLRS